METKDELLKELRKLIKDIPKDVTVLDWGYDANMDFDRVRDFVKTGLATYVCPSVVSYVSLFPRIHEANANIAGWARAAVKHGAQGLLRPHGPLTPNGPLIGPHGPHGAHGPLGHL